MFFRRNKGQARGVPPVGQQVHPQDSDTQASPQIGESTHYEPLTEAQDAPQGKSAWRLGMLVVSSALLSGIAVVLWNRRALQNMRQTQPGGPSTAGQADEKAIRWEEFI